VFVLSNGPGPVRADILSALRATWTHLAGPGTWWTAVERRQIAEAARAARLGKDLPDSSLPPAALDVAHTIAARPAHTTERWVAGVVEGLGSEEEYVEAVGIVVRVVAADTFLRLLGHEPESFLDPQPGQPGRVEVAEPRRGKTWITMGPAPVPPYVLSLVPSEMEATNRLEHALYMTGQDMEDPDFRRGALHRTQIELVASAVSWANECFY